MPDPKIYHLVDRHEADAATEQRCRHAYASMDDLYQANVMIPIHLWPEMYHRSAKDELGDPRPLPFLLELFEQFINQADDEDICVWTNSDSICHKLLPGYARMANAIWGPCSFFRADFVTPPSLELSPKNYGRQSRAHHIGRDAFCFTKKWLMSVEVPDFVLAASNWDLCFAAIIRETYQIKTTLANLGTPIFPAEPPVGYVGHVAHASAWNTPNLQNSPSNRHNGKLFKEWAAKHAPDLKFNEDFNLCV
jgi:hypothetical protein